MKRRSFIAFLGSTACTSPLAAHAQQQSLPAIGYLNAAASDGYAESLRAFRRALNDGGYVEGENVAIEYRWADNEPDRLPVLAADLARRYVSVIVAASAPASLAAAKATTTIPIVFLVPEDPVRLGLVISLARPGGNATGINFFAAELAAKRLELLRALVPDAKRVAALLNAAEPTIEAANRRQLEAAAAGMGLHLHLINAGTIAEIDAAFAVLASDRPDALFISSGPFFATRSVQLAQLAARHGIPAIGGSRRYSEVGGLITYGASVTDAHRQAGIYTGRILKGAKAADLPVVQSTKFELVINASTARMFGITLPPALLATADEVVE
ncbi:MAG: ABC transporter substrate-binding protein [Xanthobacteraceae bacterium]